MKDDPVLKDLINFKNTINRYVIPGLLTIGIIFTPLSLLVICCDGFIWLGQLVLLALVTIFVIRECISTDS